MRNTAGKGDRRSGREPLGAIADADEDLAVEHDDLLVLALVDVQWQVNAVRLLGLPHADAAAALAGIDVDDDPDAGEPEGTRAGRRRLHRVILGSDRPPVDPWTQGRSENGG